MRSWMIDSHIILVSPYGLLAFSCVVSGIGTTGGVPYTVAEEEKTSRVQSNSDIIWRRYIVAVTLLW